MKSAYDWLLCWLLQALDKQNQNLKSMGVDRFTARGEVQAFYAKPLALAYGEVNYLGFRYYFWFLNCSDSTISCLTYNLS